jgi:hypothetical protein
MSCTDPNCECKPGTFANQNPPRRREWLSDNGGFVRFEQHMLNGLEWQQVAAIKTPSGKYRVEITWALDRYRVSVIRRVQEPEKLVRVHHPLYARTAVETANKLLRYYEQNGY